MAVAMQDLPLPGATGSSHANTDSSECSRSGVSEYDGANE